VLLPSDFGISSSTARFAAEVHDDRPAVAALLSSALRLKLAIGLLVSAALIGLAEPVAAAYGEPALAWPIRWMAIAVLGQGLVSFYRYTFNAMRNASVGLRIVFGESLVEFGASIALVVAAGGAAGASAGRAVGYAFGALLALGITIRRLGPAVIRRSERLGDARRRLARYAGALFVIETAFAASVQVAPLMIGGFLGAREVGIFAAPNRLLVVLGYPGVSLSQGVAPRMARSEGHEPDVKTFAGGLRLLLIFHALILAPLIVWAGPIVDVVLGDGYEESAEILQVMGPYIFVMGISNVLAVGLNYMGEARRRLPVSFMEIGLTAGLTAALLPTVGLIGAAIAADVVSVLFVIMLLRIIVRLVDLPLRPLAVTTVRSLLAGGAAAGVLLAAGTEHIEVFDWFVAGSGALAAFFGVLLVTGELTLDELQRGWRWLRSRRTSTAGE
jgi:O-antigen/teichoic acid export membrane protein